MSLRVLGLLLLLALSPSVVSAASCADLYARLTAIHADLGTAFEEIQKLSPAVIRGEKTPKWQDFDQLDRILEAVRKGKASAAEQGKLKELEDALHEVEQSIAENASFAALREASKAAPKVALPASGTTYAPTEYALKRQYQHLLWELNKELPQGLKIRGVRIPYDSRKPQLLAQARQIVASQEKRFDPYFPNSGFEDRESLKTAIRSFSDDARRLYDRLEAEQVELAMNRPEEARWWVPRVGFQNQRITGTSKGSMDPDHRDKVEALMTGGVKAKYAALDAELKPNYGYLKPRPEDGLKQSTAAFQYGKDTYIFKKDRVRDRLTWTAGDSFGSVSYAGTPERPGPKNWQGFFVPWKDRALMVPDMLPSVQEERIGYIAGSVARKGAIAPPLPPLPREPVPPELTYPPKPVQPPRPVLPEPELPTLPKLPEAPVAEGLPIPRRGESTSDFLTRYEVSKEYRQFQERFQKYEEEVARIQATFEGSEAYLRYQAALEEYKAKSRVLDKAYDLSDEYKRYLHEQREYSQKMERYYNEYKESAEYKRYLEEYARYRSETQAVIKAHKESAPYKKYLEETEKFRASGGGGRLGPGDYKGTALEPFYSQDHYGYLELQYWGPLGLDDVEIFEFRVTPPSGEFLRELQKRGIRIRDGRVEPAVEWVPPASVP
ncbi:MAG: hypothetical protein NDJ90_03980 [Oligoflexia bacterium]|nr:hypothetical protein [Oligoflexia bacterium]